MHEASHLAARRFSRRLPDQAGSTKDDLGWRTDIDLAAITVVAVATSIGLHYVGGLFGGLLSGAIALSAHRRGLRRWALLMLATAALASLFVAASVLLQAPNR